MQCGWNHHRHPGQRAKQRHTKKGVSILAFSRLFRGTPDSRRGLLRNTLRLTLSIQRRGQLATYCVGGRVGVGANSLVSCGSRTRSVKFRTNPGHGRACLAYKRSWVRFPAPHKPVVIVGGYNYSTQNVEDGIWRFKSVRGDGVL